MHREGLSKVRRAELLARLSTLEQMITEQSARAKFYLSALTHLLGEDFGDDQPSENPADPPSRLNGAWPLGWPLGSKRTWASALLSL
jgi:hypothetical protein